MLSSSLSLSLSSLLTSWLFLKLPFWALTSRFKTRLARRKDHAASAFSAVLVDVLSRLPSLCSSTKRTANKVKTEKGSFEL